MQLFSWTTLKKSWFCLWKKSAERATYAKGQCEKMKFLRTLAPKKTASEVKEQKLSRLKREKIRVVLRQMEFVLSFEKKFHSKRFPFKFRVDGLQPKYFWFFLHRMSFYKFDIQICGVFYHEIEMLHWSQSALDVVLSMIESYFNMNVLF